MSQNYNSDKRRKCTLEWYELVSRYLDGGLSVGGHKGTGTEKWA